MSSISVKLGPNIKILLLPLVTIAVVVLIFALFLPQNISRLESKIKEYKTLQAEEAVLGTKLDSLRGVSPDLLDPNDISVVALPSVNPGMWIVSQIRSLSTESQLSVKEISISNLSDKDDIKTADVEFEVETPDYSSFLTFLKNFTTILPVTSLETVSIKRENNLGSDIINGEFQAIFHWSDFPKTLPPLNAPLKQLSADEIELIGIITGFKKPLFTELNPGVPQDRPQPFN